MILGLLLLPWPLVLMLLNHQIDGDDAQIGIRCTSYILVRTRQLLQCSRICHQLLCQAPTVCIRHAYLLQQYHGRGWVFRAASARVLTVASAPFALEVQLFKDLCTIGQNIPRNFQNSIFLFSLQDTFEKTVKQTWCFYQVPGICTRYSYVVPGTWYDDITLVCDIIAANRVRELHKPQGATTGERTVQPRSQRWHLGLFADTSIHSSSTGSELQSILLAIVGAIWTSSQNGRGYQDRERSRVL